METEIGVIRETRRGSGSVSPGFQAEVIQHKVIHIHQAAAPPGKLPGGGISGEKEEGYRVGGVISRGEILHIAVVAHHQHRRFGIIPDQLQKMSKETIQLLLPNCQGLSVAFMPVNIGHEVFEKHRLILLQEGVSPAGPLLGGYEVDGPPSFPKEPVGDVREEGPMLQIIGLHSERDPRRLDAQGGDGKHILPPPGSPGEKFLGVEVGGGDGNTSLMEFFQNALLADEPHQTRIGKGGQMIAHHLLGVHPGVEGCLTRGGLRKPRYALYGIQGDHHPSAESEGGRNFTQGIPLQGGTEEIGNRIIGPRLAQTQSVDEKIEQPLHLDHAPSAESLPDPARLPGLTIPLLLGKMGIPTPLDEISETGKNQEDAQQQGEKLYRRHHR